MNMEMFLNENNFEELVLKKLFQNKEWIRNKKVPNSCVNSRPDFRNDELKLIVEFDGYRHYTQANVIVRDKRNREEYKRLGYKVVRWPYWIQPNKNTTSILFSGFNCNFNQHFTNDHQGFISKLQSDVVPDDFCNIGLARFYNQLFTFDKETIEEVIYSIIERDYDDKFVEPSEILYFSREKERAKQNIKKFKKLYDELLSDYLDLENNN